MSEELIQSIHDRVTVLETNRIADKEVLDEIRKMVHHLHDDMTRYKGFLGAVTFFGSCLVAALTLLPNWISKHWN